MPVAQAGAQRASTQRVIVTALIAALVAGFGALAVPQETRAASIKVVIVVGPVGSSTEKYRDSARTYARLARSYGASVTELYSPYATWGRVRPALQGANLLVYLGHGNGWPSPYGPFQRYTKDGLGLNAAYGKGNSNTKYYGEYYIDRYVQMDPNAVVILNRLCYASGNSEWGWANPTKSTAIRRVDNYGAGFLRAGAKVVYAEAVNSVSHHIRSLFTSGSNVNEIFKSHPSASLARDFYVSSSRTPGMRAHMDPPRAGKYWRSIIGNLSLSAGQWRSSAR